ncbi:hypothetical protein PVK06_020100 [Gossypium arboreum]|uniref:Uncharacterized protein n=1 Tax=Gossypium arboreum TaxID=29729 RepID=A0ABR0PLJ2_GOSAR|nr:hypothetical protein PVK06_020100 [Gossypium arboreum]
MCVATGFSRDHPKLDSDMITSIILSMVKVDPRIAVSILIANIRSQFNYMPSYHKMWIAKYNALEKMHSGWDTSNNEIRELEYYPQLNDREASGTAHIISTI